ncbi:MAG: ThiF family adenylyltransferase [Acidobacteriia bacterium]|nr:ThiF family adenylyltransferase [Terriglobia bacterium]
MNNADRYSRQILFERIGAAGQERLARSRVVIIGIGALGALSTELCARAGMGSLVLVDRDFVEESNLQRQVLFDEQDARSHLPKAVAAEKKIRAINSAIQIRGLVLDANSSNIEHLVRNASLVLDGTDNFETRFLINDACVKLKVPWIYGAAVASEGAVMTILPGVTPCLRCVFEELPPAGTAPTCDTAGILAPIVSLIASLQVAETLKILTGHEGDIHRGFRMFDIWTNVFRDVKLQKARGENGCATCGERRFDFLEKHEQSRTVRLCGRNAVELLPARSLQIPLAELRARLMATGEAEGNDYLVRCVIKGLTLTVFADGRAIIQGTQDAAVAKSLFAKWVGT